MAAMMAIGIVAVLAAPREQRHTVRPIPTGDVRRAPLREAIEWLARLAVLAGGALLIGSGLAANATVLGGVLGALGAADFRETVVSAWASSAGVWVQFLAVVLGFGAVFLAASPLPGQRTRPGIYLSVAMGDPLRDFFARYQSTAAVILALICLYRIPDFVLNIMNPFYLDLGFTLVEIAEVRKIFGAVMLTLGALAAGVAVARFGLLPALVIGAFAGPLSNLIYIWLATRGHDLFALFVSIGVENVSSAFAGTCLIAYMSSLTSVQFTATQYALFSSLYAIPGKLLGSQSGRIVESAAKMADAGGAFSYLKGLFRYVVFFAYSALIGIFGIGLAFVVLRRQDHE